MGPASAAGFLESHPLEGGRDVLRRRGKNPKAIGGSEALEKWLELPDRTPRDGDPSTMEVPIPYPENEASGQEDVKILEKKAIDLVLGRCSQENREAFLRVVAGGESPTDVAADQSVRSADRGRSTPSIWRCLTS